jgi:phage N-6-adenine-methyltransferase
MNTDLMFSTGTIHWSTPQDLFDKINEEFNFTLDACANTSNYKVKNYFNEKQNGLAQSWQDNTVWVNPPYGSGISDWIKKAYNECSPNCKIIMLLPARVDTRWFHDYIYNNPDCETRFIKGRLKFSNSKSSAPFPSMIVVFEKWIWSENINRVSKLLEPDAAVSDFISAFNNQIEVDGKVDIEEIENISQLDK